MSASERSLDVPEHFRRIRLGASSYPAWKARCGHDGDASWSENQARSAIARTMPRVPKQVATPWGYTKLGTPKEGVATCLGTTWATASAATDAAEGPRKQARPENTVCIQLRTICGNGEYRAHCQFEG